MSNEERTFLLAVALSDGLANDDATKAIAYEAERLRINAEVELARAQYEKRMYDADESFPKLQPVQG